MFYHNYKFSRFGGPGWFMCVTGGWGGVSGPGDRGGMAKGYFQDFRYPNTVITVLLP